MAVYSIVHPHLVSGGTCLGANFHTIIFYMMEQNILACVELLLVAYLLTNTVTLEF